MSTSNCADLYTADKGRELEERIAVLEQNLNLLSASFIAHTNESIPTAHAYTPSVDIYGMAVENGIVISVRIDDSSSAFPIQIPEPKIEINFEGNVETINGESSLFLDLTINEENEFVIIDLPRMPVAVDTFQTSEGTVLTVQVGEERDETILLNDLELRDIISSNLDFAIDVSYLFDLLTVAVTVNDVTKRDTVYIDANVINRFGSGGGGINSGGDNVGCQDIADALQLELGEILAAIAVVQTQVNNIQEIVTVEVEGQALTKFDCPKIDPDTKEESDTSQTENYKLATLPALHEQLKFINENQLTMFKRICENSGVIALPAWWQTRLNAAVPQIACVFRKADSSTYHSISIPHPADTDKPREPLLPDYTKGNYMGMVICRDNSKFIINCIDKAEAERMCNKAIGLIDSQWLESPPRVSFSERKGQAVSVNGMSLTSMEYFESGQQNTIPNWRVRVNELE